VLDEYLKRIVRARVYGGAVETSLDRAEGLSARIGNTLMLKREDQQRTNSFKMRGAFNKIAQLDPDKRAVGVITASSGNHAQGVAYGAKVAGCRAVIVMPTSAPALKVDAVRTLGAEVVIHGSNFTEALAHALELEKTEGLTFVHPFDDPDVIAGQGTIGLEILRQHEDPIEAVFVAIGGGGMIAGIGACIKAVRPETKVIGVHAVGSEAMRISVETGERVMLPEVSLFADGVAVSQVGVETLRVAREVVDEYMTIGTDAMCAAMREVFDENRAILEPSAALTVAAAKVYAAREGLSGKTLIAVLCGSNMNFDRLGFVVERSHVGNHREALLGIAVPRGPGALATFIAAIGDHRFSELSYRAGGGPEAHVFAGIYVSGKEDTATTVAGLEAAGYGVTDLSDNELAKAHLRHFAGGRSGKPDEEALFRDERLFRLDFMETPRAFGAFLDALPKDWTVTAFHYRNHGADHASVLIGFTVPAGAGTDLVAHLEATGYNLVEETDNPACALFLR
jgi:threonine dehydratase